MQQVVQDTKHCHICIMSVMLFKGVQLTLMALALTLCVRKFLCSSGCQWGEEFLQPVCSPSPKGPVWIFFSLFFNINFQ